MGHVVGVCADETPGVATVRLVAGVVVASEERIAVLDDVRLGGLVHVLLHGEEDADEHLNLRLVHLDVGVLLSSLAETIHVLADAREGFLTLLHAIGKGRAVLHGEGRGNARETNVELRPSSLVERDDVGADLVLAIEAVLKDDARRVVLAKNLDGGELTNDPAKTGVGHATTGELELLVDVVGERERGLVLANLVALANDAKVAIAVRANRSELVSNLLHVGSEEKGTLLNLEVETNRLQGV